MLTFDAIMAALIGVLSAIASGLISYGIMQEKIKHLERDTEKNEDKYVPMQVYNAVVPQLQNSVFEIQKDIKKILQILSKSNRMKVED